MERLPSLHPFETLRSGSEAVILASWSPGEVRIAVLAGGILVDYAIWRPGFPDGVGDVYRGRVTSVIPSMAGAFVALEGGKVRGSSVHGFLPDSEGAKGITEGTVLVIQITRAAQGGKGPRLKATIGWDECGTHQRRLGLLRRGVDPLREIAARYPRALVHVDDAALAASLGAEIGGRLIRVTKTFDDLVETEVDGLSSPEVTLPSGARLSLHPTAALVAIDVDGGAALADRDAAARRHLMLNLSISSEVARQIRLRNLSGAILIDFAGMRAKSRSSLGKALTTALESDPLRPKFLGFTALGLAEITRPRVRAPLHEIITGPHAAGLAALRALAGVTRVDPGRRMLLRASPPVIAALEEDPVALADLARFTGWGLNSRSDPSLPRDGWLIEAVDG